MIFGLPVTGLGGLFYLLLTLWMPVREVRRAVRGEVCSKRWTMILVQVLLMAGLVSTMVLQAWMINRLIPGAGATSSEALGLSEHLAPLTRSQTAALIAGTVFVSLITLALVAGIVHMLRLSLRIRRDVRARLARG